MDLFSLLSHRDILGNNIIQICFLEIYRLTRFRLFVVVTKSNPIRSDIISSTTDATARWHPLCHRRVSSNLYLLFYMLHACMLIQEFTCSNRNQIDERKIYWYWIEAYLIDIDSFIDHTFPLENCWLGWTLPRLS